jgi:hypothetical protein
LGAGIAVEPSLRFDRLRPGEPGTWNPRLNAAWVQRGFVVRAAWGRYAQAQGLHELAVADGETTFGRADLAEHRVVSVERPLGAGSDPAGRTWRTPTTSSRRRSWIGFGSPLAREAPAGWS